MGFHSMGVIVTDHKEEELTHKQVEVRKCLVAAARKWREMKPSGLAPRELADFAKTFWSLKNGGFNVELALREIKALCALEILEETPSWRIKLGSKAPAEDEQQSSVFTKIPKSEWVLSNELAFAIFDGYPVSKGHLLVIPKRVVKDWFAASPKEQDAIFALIEEAKILLDAKFSPDGYNIGMNCGAAAGQTVMHLHVHLIPRFEGDMKAPRGGVRHVIPERGPYVSGQPFPPPYEPKKRKPAKG